jgi:hypothetical protein
LERAAAEEVAAEEVAVGPPRVLALLLGTLSLQDASPPLAETGQTGTAIAAPFHAAGGEAASFIGGAATPSESTGATGTMGTESYGRTER